MARKRPCAWSTWRLFVTSVIARLAMEFAQAPRDNGLLFQRALCMLGPRMGGKPALMKLYAAWIVRGIVEPRRGGHVFERITRIAMQHIGLGDSTRAAGEEGLAAADTSGGAVHRACGTASLATAHAAPVRAVARVTVRDAVRDAAKAAARAWALLLLSDALLLLSVRKVQVQGLLLLSRAAPAPVPWAVLAAAV